MSQELSYGLMIMTLALSYLLGSLPFGFWIVKGVKQVDLRQIGSGGTGMTNVKRAAGWPWAILTFILDCGKGALSVYLGLLVSSYLHNTSHVLPLICGLAAVLGHSKSCLLGFKGGKSVATGIGTFLMLAPIETCIGFLTGVILIKLFRMVSVGSIIGTITIVTCTYLFHEPLPYLVFFTIVGVYVIWLHRANMQRILNGTENKI